MTLLGELYSNGLGVPLDEVKAWKWYQLPANRGDRDAMFALAIFHVSRRGGLHDRAEAARLFASAAKLGHSAAAYDLGLLYLEGQQFPQDFGRAAELFKAAAQQGNAEAQYALATLYKDGKGVEKNPAGAAGGPRAGVFTLRYPACAAPSRLRSAVLNVMTGAARKAGRSLKRDYGEVENLRAAMKGPANFVPAADRGAEEILHEGYAEVR